MLAETALRKSEIPVFDMAIGLIAADIEALPEESIAVREKWKEKRALSQAGHAQSVCAGDGGEARQEIAPLMQWRNIRGRSDAYALDLLIARMQIALLRKSGELADLKIELMDQARRAADASEPGAREGGSHQAREVGRVLGWHHRQGARRRARTTSRDHASPRTRQAAQPLPPKIVDITEDAAAASLQPARDNAENRRDEGLRADR